MNDLNKFPSREDQERAERIRGVLDEIHVVNLNYPVIVEGKRDERALRQLGIVGEIILLHRGKGLYEFCEDIAERFDRVVLLLDWDMQGETLFRTVSRHLEGHWEEMSSYRDILKILCQKEVKDIEGIPKLLSRLEGNEYPG